MSPERENKIELTVPAEREMMLVVRLTTSGALARSGLSLDAVDDMKLAAEEACTCLIRSSRCQALSLTYWIEDGYFCLNAQTGTCDCGCAPGVSDEEIEVIRCVLLSMTDTVHMSFEGNHLRAIAMRKWMPH